MLKALAAGKTVSCTLDLKTVVLEALDIYNLIDHPERYDVVEIEYRPGDNLSWREAKRLDKEGKKVQVKVERIGWMPVGEWFKIAEQHDIECQAYRLEPVYKPGDNLEWREARRLHKEGKKVHFKTDSGVWQEVVGWFENAPLSEIKSRQYRLALDYVSGDMLTWEEAKKLRKEGKQVQVSSQDPALVKGWLYCSERFVFEDHAKGFIYRLAPVQKALDGLSVSGFTQRSAPKKQTLVAAEQVLAVTGCDEQQIPEDKQAASADQPAFPMTDLVVSDRKSGSGDTEHSEVKVTGSNGLTKREYAAIHLGVPCSGDEIIDAMISQSNRQKWTAMAMQGMFSDPSRDQTVEEVAHWSTKATDSLFVEFEKAKQ